MTLAALYRSIESPAIRDELERADWNLSRAAASLSCHPATVLRAIRRHPELAAEYKRRSKGPGRPKKAEKPSE